MQMAANMYQMNVKVLDTALEKQKWTNLTPDPEMKDHTCPVCEVLTY